MTQKHEQKFAAYLLRILYLAIGTLSLYILFHHWAYDDPFITYRYAYNLAHGFGFVYNPGERVLSTTTPLFTMLLAVLSHLWSDLPHLANLIGAASLVLGGLFIWELGRAWTMPLVGWTGLFLYPTFPLLITTLGSETPLYLAFCLGTYTFYARKNYRWAAAFAAMAVLTRPDGVIIPVILAIHFLLSQGFLPGITRKLNQTIPWQAVLIFLGLTLPWFLFAWGYFGSPLPVTLATKQHQGAMAISQQFSLGFFSQVKQYAKHWYYWLEASLALLGLAYMLWKARRWTILLAWTVLYFVGYSVLGVSAYYWYYAPLVPGLLILTGLGITAIFRLAQKSLQTLPTPDTRDRQSVLLALTLLVLLVIAQGNQLWQLRHWSDRRVALYQAVGKWLDTNTPPGAKIGALEVGIIGYYAQRPMIDFAGLIQPRVASQLTASTTYAEAAAWAVDHYHPDYLVLFKQAFPELEGDYVARHCQIANNFPGEKYGFNFDLNIYACHG